VKYTIKERVTVTELHTYEVEADSIEEVQDVFGQMTPEPVTIERLNAEGCEDIDDLEITSSTT